MTPGIDDERRKMLARLPGVDTLLAAAERRGMLAEFPRRWLLAELRCVLEGARRRILAGEAGADAEFDVAFFLDEAAAALALRQAPRLQRVINATGVVIHTNLGRSPLPAAALEQVTAVARGYSNLEYNLEEGRRGIRYANVEELLCELSGAEAAMVVNNNAGAVLLALSALAAGREVVVSRGELVEIGGAFRIPEIVVQGGAGLREVGATNRTHLRDYEAAIGEQTALLLKVHTSNYRISGFTGTPSARELVALGRRYGLPVLEDLGSGNLIDLRAFGLPGEPTVAEVVSSGVALATFSGDKLLGGPQAGIIVGRRDLVGKLKQHPLNRALRIDKMTLAALEATLKCFLEPERAVEQVPTLRMLTRSPAALKRAARRLCRRIARVCGAAAGLELEIVAAASRAGGGALPESELPTYVVALRLVGKSPARLEAYLRGRRVPIVARIVEERLFFDPRTLQPGDESEIAAACRELLAL